MRPPSVTAAHDDCCSFLSDNPSPSQNPLFDSRYGLELLHPCQGNTGHYILPSDEMPNRSAVAGANHAYGHPLRAPLTDFFFLSPVTTLGKLAHSNRKKSHV